ncbi:MAG: dockerin type I repeat-containing protein [Ruminococcus sp.]|nr:dockerin type I repeat-containing protein [Ruminococcus sp.]
MKRLLSILTAAVMTFSPAFTSVSGPAVSADTGSDLPEGFGYMECEIGEDTVNFTSDSLNTTMFISTNDEFEISLQDDRYEFKPARNGKYVLSVLVTTSIPNVTFGMEWTFYSRLITADNGHISTRKETIYRHDEHDGTVTFTPAFGEPSSYTYYGNDILGGETCLIGNLLNVPDHFFIYALSERERELRCCAFVTRASNTAGLWLKNDGLISPIEPQFQLRYDERNIPAAPETDPPASLAFIGFQHDLQELEVIPDIVKCEGKRTLIYSIDEDENENLLPDSLVITECPENDINADGEFSVADAVLLEKWLLGAGDTGFVNWRSADLNSDGVLDTFDLCFLKDKLL